MGACSPWLGSPRSGRRRVGKGLAGAGAPGPLAPPMPAANLVGAAAPGAPALYSYILATPYIETPGANNRRFFLLPWAQRGSQAEGGVRACVRACGQAGRAGRLLHLMGQQPPGRWGLRLRQDCHRLKAGLFDQTAGVAGPRFI
jgi:hypothetical protein